MTDKSWDEQFEELYKHDPLRRAIALRKRAQKEIDENRLIAENYEEMEIQIKQETKVIKEKLEKLKKERKK